MPLTGLLDLVRQDPVLDQAVRSAGAVPSIEVVAPQALRPVVAALWPPTHRRGAGRPVLVVTATGREAEDLVDALRCLLDPDAVADFPAWETLPHERLSPRADTVGRRLAVLRRLAHPEPDDPATGPLRWSSPRCAACCSRWCPGSATSSRSSCAPATSADLDDVVERSSGAATPASSWSRSAASSPSAAASSTSSRRPRSTRCGWSSGATRSRRSATSPSPTSARSRSAEHGCGRRRAASCCSPTEVRARGRGAGRRAPGARRDARQARRGHRRRGHGVAGPGARRRACELLPTCCRPARTCWSATPSGCAPGPPTWCAPREEFLAASWAAAAGGGAGADRPRARRRFRDLAEVRDAPPASAGCPGGRIGAVHAADRGRRADARRPLESRRPVEPAIAATRAAAPSSRARAGSRDGWRVVAGLRRATARPQRAVERLAEADVGVRLGARPRRRARRRASRTSPGQPRARLRRRRASGWRCSPSTT